MNNYCESTLMGKWMELDISIDEYIQCNKTKEWRANNVQYEKKTWERRGEERRGEMVGIKA